MLDCRAILVVFSNQNLKAMPVPELPHPLVHKTRGRVGYACGEEFLCRYNV